MDFDKLNSMIDELNKNFAIVENETSKLNESSRVDEIEIVKNFVTYMNNWRELALKIGGRKWFYVYANNEHENEIHIDSNGYMSFCYERKTVCTYCCTESMEINMRNTGNCGYYCGYYSQSYPKEWIKVVKVIQSIDYEYIEKQMSEFINEEITKKAERIEKAYNNAVNRRGGNND